MEFIHHYARWVKSVPNEIWSMQVEETSQTFSECMDFNLALKKQEMKCGLQWGIKCTLPIPSLSQG